MQAYPRPAAWLYYFIVVIFTIAFKVFFGVRIQRDPALRKIKGPMIILGNHQCYFDPPIAGLAFYYRRLNSLASDNFFRKPVSRWVFRKVASIPKVQFRTDSQAAKDMIRVIHGGGCLLIYPEGQRSLDGAGQYIDEAIAKLVKKMRCPVAVVHQQGGYLTWPRWSKSGARFGRIDVKASLLFSETDLAEFDLAEIQQRIEKALAFNDYDWQAKRRKPFHSRKPALGLHNLCHQCPACSRILAMESGKRDLTCRYCGNQAHMDRFGFLNPVGDAKIFPDPYRWHQWQKQEMAKMLAQPDFLLEFAARAEIQHRDGTTLPAGTGTIQLSATQITFNSDELNIALSLQNKIGISIKYGRSFEISQADQSYRFKLDQGQAVVLISDAILTSRGENVDNSI